MVAAGAFAVRGVAQPAELETGEQAEHTTLVAPPYAHTLGIHRARTAHLRLFLGDRTRFDDPQGLAAVKFAADDDPEVRGDDFQLTLFGVNAGRGEILYNSSMRTLAIWGREGSSDDELLDPHGIAATVDGRVYVADTGNRRVVRLRWDPSARALRRVGSWAAGEPFDVEADTRGQVWVADREANAVLRFADREAGAGSDLLPAESAGDRWPLPADVVAPLGLAVADSLEPWLQPNATRLYLVDRDGARLRAYDPNGAVLAEVSPADLPDAGAAARFLYVELDYFGNVYVSDPAIGAVHKLDGDLRPLDTFRGPGPAESALEEPRGIAIWKRFGQVFVAEREGAQYFFVGTDFHPLEEPVRMRHLADGSGAIRLFVTEPATVRLAFLDAAGDTLGVAIAGTVGSGVQTVTWNETSWAEPAAEGWADRAATVVVEARPTYSSRKKFARVERLSIVRDEPLTGP